MILRGRISLFSLPTLLLLSLTGDVAVSQFEGMGGLPDTQQSLGEVLMTVLDKNKDQMVTMEEIKSMSSTLELLLEQNGAGNEDRTILEGAKGVAPTVFKLLDANNDQKVSQSEMKFTTDFEKSLKKGGGMLELVRACFEILDVDGDDKLSVGELLLAVSGETLSKLAEKLHGLFPLRETHGELEGVLRLIIESICGTDVWNEESVAEGIRWIDANGDGTVQRGEMGTAYKIYGKQFLKIAETVKSVGPMFAMLTGGNTEF